MFYLSNTLPRNWPLMLYGNRNRVVTFLEEPPVDLYFDPDLQ